MSWYSFRFVTSAGLECGRVDRRTFFFCFPIQQSEHTFFAVMNFLSTWFLSLEGKWKSYFQNFRAHMFPIYFYLTNVPLSEIYKHVGVFFVGLQIRNWIICRPRFLCLNWKKKKLIGTIDATKRPEQLAVGPFFHPSPNVFEYNQTLTFSYQIKTESSRNCVLRHDVSGARFFFFWFRVRLVCFFVF